MSAVRVSGVLVGLAEFMDSEGVAVWRPDTPYQASERAVAMKLLPSQPDNAVALTVYDVDDDMVLPDVEFMVQFRFRAARGPITAVDEFADDLFDVLHMRHMFSAGSLTIQRARRVSAAPMGADDNQRHERADNYSLVLMRG